MVDGSVPLKHLSAKEEFSALVNWIRHDLPEYQNMELRIEEEGMIYQTILRKHRREIRVGTIKNMVQE